MSLEKTDIVKVLTIIRTNYENAFKVNGKEEFIILADSWYDCLREFPKEVVFEALKNALKKSEFAPRLATIIKEIEKMQEANGETAEKSWEGLEKVLYEVNNNLYKLKFTQYIEANGFSQSENAKNKIRKIYDDLSEEVKEIVPSVESLIFLASVDDLSYEKSRFIKAYPQIRERLKMRKETKEFLQCFQVPKNLFLES